MRRYSAEEKTQILAQCEKVAEVIHGDAQRLLRHLIRHELEQGPKPDQLLAKNIAHALWGNRDEVNKVAATKGYLRKRLAEYYEAVATRQDRHEIGLTEEGYGVSFRRRGTTERFPPRKLVLVCQFLRAPTQIPISPGLFVGAAMVPALWILICRVLRWHYYLGGSGNEPAGWPALVWGAASALPVATYTAIGLWRAPAVLTTRKTKMRITGLLLIQTGAAGGGASLFYNSSLRALIERWMLPGVFQELVIAALWSSLFAGALLLSTLVLFRWEFRDVMKELVLRVIVPLALLVAIFQLIIPHSQAPPDCVPRLVMDQARGIVVQAVASCLPLTASFVFDQARGLLAGVALPFFALYALKGFVKGVQDEGILPRGYPRVIYFKITPQTIPPGGLATLSWKTTGGSQVSISSVGNVNPKGSITASPQRTATYELRAENSEHEYATTMVKITVAPGEVSQKS